MGVMDLPKAMYKAQQAKKKMSKISVAGKDGAVGVLLNGLNEVMEVEIDLNEIKILLPMLSEIEAKNFSVQIAKNIKKSLNNAKKELEKEMMKSTSFEDLKELLSGGQ